MRDSRWSRNRHIEDIVVEWMTGISGVHKNSSSYSEFSINATSTSGSYLSTSSVLSASITPLSSVPSRVWLHSTLYRPTDQPQSTDSKSSSFRMQPHIFQGLSLGLGTICIVYNGCNGFPRSETRCLSSNQPHDSPNTPESLAKPVSSEMVEKPQV
jgi:hypothetical protein